MRRTDISPVIWAQHICLCSLSWCIFRSMPSTTCIQAVMMKWHRSALWYQQICLCKGVLLLIQECLCQKQTAQQLMLGKNDISSAIWAQHTSMRRRCGGWPRSMPSTACTTAVMMENLTYHQSYELNTHAFAEELCCQPKFMSNTACTAAGAMEELMFQYNTVFIVDFKKKVTLHFVKDRYRFKCLTAHDHLVACCQWLKLYHILWNMPCELSPYAIYLCVLGICKLGQECMVQAPPSSTILAKFLQCLIQVNCMLSSEQRQNQHGSRWQHHNDKTWQLFLLQYISGCLFCIITLRVIGD